MRVLLADADNEFLEIVQSFLRYRGHEAEIAADGLQCISILHAFDPDLLVLDRDLLWGGREGVLQQMRQDPRFATVPVILTGDGQTADEVFARSACPVACLAKPYRLGDLLTHINKAGGPVRSALFCN